MPGQQGAEARPHDDPRDQPPQHTPVDRPVPVVGAQARHRREDDGRHGRPEGDVQHVLARKALSREDHRRQRYLNAPPAHAEHAGEKADEGTDGHVDEQPLVHECSRPSPT